jgi:hypothetical protein
MEQKQYDNTNRGAVWDNTASKRPDRKDPDLSGKINVEGKEFQISMWVNEKPGDRQPKFDISVKPAQQSVPF